MSYMHYEKRKMTKRNHKKLQMRPKEKVQQSEKNKKLLQKKLIKNIIKVHWFVLLRTAM